MDFTCPEPMVYSTNLAHWPKDLPARLAAMARPELDFPDFKPVHDWPVFGLRPAEISALRFIHRHGPMMRADFLRKFKGTSPKGRPVVLHDLNRLGFIRLVLVVDGDGKEGIAIQSTGPVDFDELERTVCPI